MPSFSVEEAYQKANGLLSGQFSDNEAKTLLSSLALRGETVDEVVGFAKAMREVMIKVDLGSPLIDVCGSGGSGKDRFNISTAVSILLACDSVPVAKHGNRGSRAYNGSFDFLEALGIPFYQDPKAVSSQFRNTGVGFLFARYFHPLVGALAPIRAALGHASIFNVLGPLCNPATVSHQVIGTPSKEKALLISGALLKLGTTKSIVIHGHDGRDELSITSKSTLYCIENNQINLIEFDPSNFISGVIPDEALSCKDAKESARLFEDLLTSKNETHPISQWLFLNAAVALWCFGRVASITDGINHSKLLFRSSKILDLLNRLRA